MVEKLNHLSLKIIWVSGSKSVRISTNNFTLQEVQLLSQMFKTKFDLDCTIQLLSKKGNTPKDKYLIYIKVASLPKLRELVLPYTIPSMKYKLGFRPRTGGPGSASPHPSPRSTI